jgi:uncharacterized membrane protein YobD (UPF0266 family)
MEDSRDYKSNPILIGLAVIGGLCILIWALSNFVLDFEFITLNFADIRIRFIGILFFIIVLLTAQFVYIDANNIDAGEASPEQKTFRAMTWSPTSWGVLVFFIWFIMFPLYLYKREEIFWQNISVEYSALKTIERDIKTVSHKKSNRPAPPKKEYSENIGICPTCDTPYPIRMLERSKFCSRCGGLLVKDE